MLKVLPLLNTSTTNVKCGEIFCQSSTNFTIVCTFCELKIFEFEDFVLHFRNVHFENNLLKTEGVNVKCAPYLEVDEIKKESNNAEDTFSDKINEAGFETESEDEIKLMSWRDNDCEDDKNDNDWSGFEDEDDEYVPKVKPKGLSPKNKVYKCEHCEKLYKTATQYRLHIKHKHQPIDLIGTPPAIEEPSEITILKCSKCEKGFPSQRSLDAHQIKDHSGLKCDQCDKIFKMRHLLNRHQVIHTGIKNFICEFEKCGKKFYTQRHLSSHRRNVHMATKNFICDICGYSYRTSEMLRVHYRSHTGEKPYCCSLCEKRFASCSLLSEHKASHKTDRPHICDVCGATFSRPKALYHHKHLHLGFKKFKCKICGNAYAQAAGLAGHMRKHKEEGI